MENVSQWCTHHIHTQRGQNADQRHEIMRSTFTCKNILQSILLLIEMGPTLLYGLAYKFHHLSEDDRAISHDCKMQYAICIRICICILRCMHRKKLLSDISLKIGESDIYIYVSRYTKLQANAVLFIKHPNDWHKCNSARINGSRINRTNTAQAKFSVHIN